MVTTLLNAKANLFMYASQGAILVFRKLRVMALLLLREHCDLGWMQPFAARQQTLIKKV